MCQKTHWTWRFGRPAGDRYQQANDADGIAQLIKQLRKVRPALVVCEATGGWERLLVGALATARLPIVVVNPRQVRDFARLPGDWLRPIAWMLRSLLASPRQCGQNREHYQVLTPVPWTIS
jgi:Transposase